MPESMNINEVIRTVIKVLENIFEKRITVEYALAEDLMGIEADKYQINQVLTNLIINACDAMPTGGVLTLQSENVNLHAGQSATRPEIPTGEYIKFSVSDTGVGIPADDLKHIFEPFYTTKTEGGTGLGLAMVNGIIENNRGLIEVKSSPGFKTTFEIYLPASHKTPAIRPARENLEKGKGTVLVVDDEDHVRRLGKLMLERLGYKVLSARNGVEAVDVFRQHNLEIDIVLLDMIMPLMTGKEAYIEMTSIRPDVKVLIISGYSQSKNVQDVVNMGANGFMQKPFKLNDLSRAIKKVLEN